jgi:hypothetical protein
MTVNPVSVTSVASALVGCVGGTERVVTIGNGKQLSEYKIFDPVIDRIYIVPGVRSVNTADF